MKGYESRVWVCWSDEMISYTQPKRCKGVGHQDCGLFEVLVPISNEERWTRKAKRTTTATSRVQGEAQRG